MNNHYQVEAESPAGMRMHLWLEAPDVETVLALCKVQGIKLLSVVPIGEAEFRATLHRVTKSNAGKWALQII